MSGGIFVSYRRDDTKHAAGRLVERLGRTFDSNQLFLDIDNIAPGLNFKKVLTEKVQACDVLLAVIGPNWLASSDETGARRLNNPKDFVRIEIEAALARDVRVIPVLVDGARMPAEAELPETLRPLADHQAVRLAHERFAAEADDLTRALKESLAAAEQERAARTDAERKAAEAARLKAEAARLEAEAQGTARVNVAEGRERAQATAALSDESTFVWVFVGVAIAAAVALIFRFLGLF